MAEQRVLIGNSSGTLLAEIQPDLGPVSWRLNEVGRVQFAMTARDTKATEEILRFGNRIFIEFDSGLPNWVGVIDTPREWNSRIILCNAYSGEAILGTRQTDRGRYFSDQTVGEIYQALIDEANSVSDTGITIGDIWKGGASHYPEYHYKNLLAIIRESLCGALSEYDFDVTGSLSGGKITMQANLYERKGAEKANVVLLEGVNIQSPRLVEQGEIVNAWDLAGAGDGWSETARIYSHAEDVESISRYGLRQGQKIYNDVSYQETLDSHAQTLLDEYKDTHAMIDLQALDIAPALFGAYGVGDTVRLQLYNYGFGGYDGLIHVEGREYDPGTGLCRLVVREE